MDSGLAAFAAIRKTPATYNPGSGERRLLSRGHAPSSETCSIPRSRPVSRVTSTFDRT